MNFPLSPFPPFSLKTPILMFFLHFTTPPKPNHKLYLWLIILFPPHITHTFDSQSFLVSSFHAFPISKLRKIKEKVNKGMETPFQISLEGLVIMDR
jgi:hypothetical protein